MAGRGKHLKPRPKLNLKNEDVIKYKEPCFSIEVLTVHSSIRKSSRNCFLTAYSKKTLKTFRSNLTLQIQ